MQALSKLCDAADWFDPEFDRIVRSELEEAPRFHRKQWEFVQIFRALRSLGYLGPSSRGLSMGGGTERLLYAVVRHAAHLTVTDLYEPGSAWDSARTGDPDRHVKALAPFPIDESRVTARRMDMRVLEYADASFDFCYSSCAIEHIGDHDDFLRHLAEVRRVLKDDGVYVLTTEFHYGAEVIRLPNNYYFSAGYLSELIGAAGFASIGDVDARIWPHEVNRPRPANLGHLSCEADGGLTGTMLRDAPHLQLLVGAHPFTSLCLVLRKVPTGSTDAPLRMIGIDDSRRFIATGVTEWRAVVERSRLRLDPFGLLTGPRPGPAVPRRLGHSGPGGAPPDALVFHSGYVWLGSGRRQVGVDVELWPADAGDVQLELRLHRQRTLEPALVECVASVPVAACERATVTRAFVLEPDAAWCYALLGHVVTGTCWAGRVAVELGACVPPP